MISPELEDLLSVIESSGESAAANIGEHLRLVAGDGDEAATVEHLRSEAENLVAWAATFLRETGGIRPEVLRRFSSTA